MFRNLIFVVTVIVTISPGHVKAEELGNVFGEQTRRGSSVALDGLSDLFEGLSTRELGGGGAESLSLAIKKLFEAAELMSAYERDNEIFLKDISGFVREYPPIVDVYREYRSGEPANLGDVYDLFIELTLSLASEIEERGLSQAPLMPSIVDKLSQYLLYGSAISRMYWSELSG